MVVMYVCTYYYMAYRLAYFINVFNIHMYVTTVLFILSVFLFVCTSYRLATGKLGPVAIIGNQDGASNLTFCDQKAIAYFKSLNY